MSDYEHIVISAVRYALGRMTYIVELTVNYVMNQIENDILSDQCLSIIVTDIKNKILQLKQLELILDQLSLKDVISDELRQGGLFLSIKNKLLGSSKK